MARLSKRRCLLWTAACAVTLTIMQAALKSPNYHSARAGEAAEPRTQRSANTDAQSVAKAPLDDKAHLAEKNHGSQEDLSRKKRSSLFGRSIMEQPIPKRNRHHLANEALNGTYRTEDDMLQARFPQALPFLDNLFAFPDWWNDSSVRRHHQLSKNDRRGYTVLLPDGYNAEKRQYPMMMLFFGCQRAFVPPVYGFHCETGLPSRALSEGYIVVIPRGRSIEVEDDWPINEIERLEGFPDWWLEGPLHGFSAGKADLTECPKNGSTNDVDFIHGVVMDVRERYRVNERNVTLVGASTGSAMVLNLTCSLPTLFQNVVMVGALVSPAHTHGYWNCDALRNDDGATSAHNTLFIYGNDDVGHGKAHIAYLKLFGEYMLSHDNWLMLFRKTISINTAICAQRVWQSSATSRQLYAESCIVKGVEHCWPFDNKCSWQLTQRMGKCGAGKFDATDYVFQWLHRVYAQAAKKAPGKKKSGVALRWQLIRENKST